MTAPTRAVTSWRRRPWAASRRISNALACGFPRRRRRAFREPQRGIRFLRCLRVHANAHAPLFRTAHQRGRFGLAPDAFSTHAYKLRKRRHSRSSFSFGSSRKIVMRGHRIKRADTFCGLLRCARTNTQEHTTMLKGLLRIRRDQQETPHALQEAELSSWYRIGEAYSAFRGWRPIPAALLSHSIDLVPGPKNSLPTSHPPLARGLTARSKIPLTKHKV